MQIETARPEDAPAVASVVNAAYQVERFFVQGDRTSPDDVAAAMARGRILVVRGDDGRIAGTIFIEVDGPTASFGMLAVDPAAQGQGLGRRLIAAAEDHARQAGATAMEIDVVNLREDLFPRYERLGYRPVGEAPYVHRPTIRPCHFIRMRKALY